MADHLPARRGWVGLMAVPPYLAATSRELNEIAADIAQAGGPAFEVDVRAGEFRVSQAGEQKRGKRFVFPTSAEVRAFLTGLRAATEGGR
jgi:hypothetical protein